MCCLIWSVICAFHASSESMHFKPGSVRPDASQHPSYSTANCLTLCEEPILVNPPNHERRPRQCLLHRFEV